MVVKSLITLRPGVNDLKPFKEVQKNLRVSPWQAFPAWSTGCGGGQSISLFLTCK
jgi:hypothetical protein